eukprot:m.32428 g.32428  ORF g.32428 m.32428 type:complete len:68 (-) comp16641_c0_seq3:65-268(-)
MKGRLQTTIQAYLVLSVAPIENTQRGQRELTCLYSMCFPGQHFSLSSCEIEQSLCLRLKCKELRVGL